MLTPEEWVRQHVIHQLIENGFPVGRISIERSLPNSKKRYDIVVFDEEGMAQLLIECKAPKVQLTQKTLDQVANYIALQNVPNVLLTNGLRHFYISRKIDGLQIVQEIPKFSTLSG
ncbi:MAG: type I restriction enzyme HsdR N-terminal domain-containing protein [Bacteroidia bacterium]|nr:type I restriction enzyme HsdR N-terminal domain-containing protein [Bacteroidia bacterium]